MTDRKTHFLTIVGGATLAAVILFASLLKTASIQASSEATQSSGKKFYLASDIKPDHVLYPVKGGFNSLQLQILPPREKVRHQLTYAQQKMGYTDYLLSQQDQSMAVANLVRGHQYLLLAADEAISLQDRELAQLVHAELEEYSQKFASVSGQLPTEYQDALQQLMVENKAARSTVEPLSKQL